MDKRLEDTKRVKILDTYVDVLTMEETVQLVEKYVQKKEPLHLMGVNADKINMARQNPRLMEIVNGCGIINADGASVVMAGRYLNRRLPERVAGVDLMLELVKLSEKKEYSIYLLGAKQAVVTKAAQELEKIHPNLKIVGIHDGYFKENQWAEISKELKEKAPDFCFVGITSPMKEYLIEFLQNDGNACVFMGVGGTFDVLSGEISRAPVWMQKCSMEWMYRVMQEPKRLFKRYFVGNTVFIASVIKEKRK